MSPEIDPLHRFLATCVKAGWMPAAAWWVGAGRQVVSRGAVGQAGPNEPVSVETPFDLASLTKPLATALLLALHEQDGLLDLDAPLESWIPQLAGSAYGPASLLQAATHTAGLPAWAPLFLDGSSTEAYAGAIASLAPASERGRTLYSDLGYILLGHVLERSAGQTLDALFDERVAAPLRLRRTGYAREPRRFAGAPPTESGSHFERRMAPTRSSEPRWRNAIPRGQVHDSNAHGVGGVAGHAGLFGSVEELARLAGELLRPEGLALGARARQRLLQVVPGTAGRTVGLVAADHAGATRGVLPSRAVGHAGFTGTSLWIDPQREESYLLLSNRVHPTVPEREFRWLRRGFHRIARSLAAD